MHSLHHFYAKNTQGTDFAVGDIHGSFPALQTKLDAIGFNPEVDRLFATGDLVDKGEHSRLAYDWLHRDWFKSTRGNHDGHIVEFGKPTNSLWIENFGKWFSYLKPAFQKQMQEAFAQLPVVITVETDGGFIGIVHAGTPFDTWYETLSHVDTAARKADMNHLMYSRKGFEKRHLARPMRDLRALVVGHCPVPAVEQHANVWYMDADAYVSQQFTLLNLHTLELV